MEKEVSLWYFDNTTIRMEKECKKVRIMYKYNINVKLHFETEMKETIIRSLQFQWSGCYVGWTITWSCNTWLRYPWGVANFQNDLSEAEIQKRKHQSTGRSVSPRFWCPELLTSFAGSRGSWGHSGWLRVRGRLKYIRPDWSWQGWGSEVNFASISWLMSLDRKWYFIFVFYSHHWIELNQSLKFCHNLKFGNWEHRTSFHNFVTFSFSRFLTGKTNC